MDTTLFTKTGISREMPAAPVHILSLGAGVQSSTMLLMASQGLFGIRPDYVIFADTGSEPESVYQWLDWLTKQIDYPFFKVEKGNLGEKVLEMKVTADGRRYSKTDVPLFTRNHDGSQGKISHRSCTRDYKIHPIRKKSRELAAVKRGEKEVRIISWQGISTDEASRMRAPRDHWIAHWYPLIDAGISRLDCLEWMQANGYPKPPRSACYFCPFHSNAEWQRMKTEEPAEFRRAVAFERNLQAAKANSDNFQAVPYLHRECEPLDTIDFRARADQINLFDNECEGICGV